MKNLMLLLIGVMLGVGGIELYEFMMLRATKPVNMVEQEVIAKPLEKYTIDNLGKREYQSEIFLDKAVATLSAYTAYSFHFDSDGKKVSGQAHVPDDFNGKNKCPVIVQFRGYAPVEDYKSGYGTEHSAETFAANGFISLAPDFLGYGESASPSADVFEARFETYTTAMNLLIAAKKWEYGNGKIGIWGHSNGGQLVMTVLEISGESFPTSLWAPVSAPFPYSILYFMSDNEEGDKNLRKKLVIFEDIYDTALFDPMNYLQNIQAPIQLHQGTSDESVPVEWSRDLVKELSGLGKKIKYYEYPGADHNLVPDWSRVIERDVAFFKQMMAK
jgi:dipeptidyl aminopeptidase/acylaminoacyl peptidase